VQVYGQGTFVYLGDSGVPVVSLRRHVSDVPHAPKHLEATRRKGVEDGKERIRSALAVKRSIRALLHCQLGRKVGSILLKLHCTHLYGLVCGKCRCLRGEQLSLSGILRVWLAGILKHGCLEYEQSSGGQHGQDVREEGL
jgi:hypothetical protein